MATSNYESLVAIDPIDSGTPTVYDLNTKKKIDICQSDWLDTLMSSS